MSRVCARGLPFFKFGHFEAQDSLKVPSMHGPETIRENIAIFVYMIVEYHTCSFLCQNQM